MLQLTCNCTHEQVKPSRPLTLAVRNDVWLRPCPRVRTPVDCYFTDCYRIGEAAKPGPASRLDDHDHFVNADFDCIQAVNQRTHQVPMMNLMPDASWIGTRQHSLDDPEDEVMSQTWSVEDMFEFNGSPPVDPSTWHGTHLATGVSTGITGMVDEGEAGTLGYMHHWTQRPGEAAGPASSGSDPNVSRREFVAAAKFNGHKRGYIFTMGPSGLGSYVDDQRHLGCLEEHASWSPR